MHSFHTAPDELQLLHDGTFVTSVYTYETTFALSHFSMTLLCPPLVHENKCLECTSIVEHLDSLMRMHNDICSLFSFQACFGHP